MRNLLITAVLLSTLPSMADGSLGFSVKYENGFWRADVVEKGADREGILGMPGGRYPMKAYYEENQLHLNVGDVRLGELTVSVPSPEQTLYEGELFQHAASIEVVKNLQTGTMLMKGKIGTRMEFKHQTWVDKKGKKSAKFTWFDTAAEHTTGHIDISFNSEKLAGSCTGKIFLEVLEIGVFACKSTGKLEDAFFKSEMDVIAWLVHLVLNPSEKPE